MKNQRRDRIVRYLGNNDQWSLSLLQGKDIVEEARLLHDDSPIATKVLGEALLACAFLADYLKGKGGLVNVQVDAKPGVGRIIAIANNKGEVKGYVANPKTEEPLDGGSLALLVDEGNGHPFSSGLNFAGSRLDKAINRYFTNSAQRLAYMRIDIVLDEDGRCIEASGIYFQGLPGASISEYYDKKHELDSLPTLSDLSTQRILNLVFGKDRKKQSSRDLYFRCNCSQEKGFYTLASLPEEELKEMIALGEEVTITCGCCAKQYHYSIPELEKALESKAIKKA